MTSSSLDSPTPAPASRRVLPLVFLLFVGSGCASLIDEVVWFQVLQLVIGSTATSLAVLLGTFMGGMCLGSLLLPRLVSRRWNPLVVYAVLELGIGALALLILWGMTRIDHLYLRYAGRGVPDVLLREGVAVACLLLPTLLMGATLPAVARWVESDGEGVSWLGVFYAGNLAGAVVGCLLAGFYLLRVHDVVVATFTAFALNVVVAGVAMALAFGPARYEPPARVAPVGRVEHSAGAWTVYLAIALSGMSALGAEVVWTRLLSLLLGGTVYTFSLILSVFLIGLGIGSTVGALIARRTASARLALGLSQWLLTAAIAWTAVMIAKSLPYWPIVPGLSSSPWYGFQLDLVRCLWAVLPAALLWGASFPLALAAVAVPGHDTGRLVGRVYGANTIGAIAGAVAFSIWLVPLLGTAGAERVLIAIAATAALVAFLPLVRPAHGPIRAERAVWLLAATSIAGGFAWSVSPVPWPVVAFGRETVSMIGQSAPGIVTKVPEDAGDADVFCTYVGEGTNVSVAVTLTADGVRSFHGAGKIQASTLPADMRLQRMLGHLSALAHKKPESVMVVACGAGVTAGTFVVHPDVKRVVICDIEPLVPKVVTPMFGEQNYHVVDGIARENPHTVRGKQVELVYDDGRHFLRTTREKFDVITSDPIDPWVKGCAALNTVEYFQACRDRLKPGGIVSLWIPLYESNLDTTKSVIATFFQVFPHGILWSNERQGYGSDALWGDFRYGYDAVLFGQVEPTVIDVDEFERRLDRPDHELVKQSLREVGFGESEDDGTVTHEAVDLLATYAGQAPLLREWTRGAQINTDRNLRLQYLAGMSLNTSMSARILSGILDHYEFPDRTFVGSAERLGSLRRALSRGGRKHPPVLARDQATPH